MAAARFGNRHSSPLFTARSLGLISGVIDNISDWTKRNLPLSLAAPCPGSRPHLAAYRHCLRIDTPSCRILTLGELTSSPQRHSQKHYLFGPSWPHSVPPGHMSADPSLPADASATARHRIEMVGKSRCNICSLREKRHCSIRLQIPSPQWRIFSMHKQHWAKRVTVPEYWRTVQVMRFAISEEFIQMTQRRMSRPCPSFVPGK
jgi:hypothetical protein